MDKLVTILIQICKKKTEDEPNLILKQSSQPKQGRVFYAFFRQFCLFIFLKFLLIFVWLRRLVFPPKELSTCGEMIVILRLQSTSTFCFITNFVVAEVNFFFRCHQQHYPLRFIVFLLYPTFFVNFCFSLQFSPFNSQLSLLPGPD